MATVVFLSRCIDLCEEVSESRSNFSSATVMQRPVQAQKDAKLCFLAHDLARMSSAIGLLGTCNERTALCVSQLFGLCKPS